MSQYSTTHRHRSINKPLICNRCTTPLKLNCFKQIEDEIFAELCNSDYAHTVTAEKDDRNILLPIFNKKLESSVMRKVVLPIDIPDVTNDFMIIGDFNSLPLVDNTKSLKITNVLQNLTSENVTLDHPICEDCTDNILDQMDSQLKSVEDEHNVYQEYLDNYTASDEDDIEELEAELRKLKTTELMLETRLQEYEAEEKNVKEILQSYTEESESLEKKEQKQLAEYSLLKHKLLCLEDDEHSVNNQLMYAQSQLNKLANMNVFSATFHIWHSGYFGTINNFRLGRLPSEPVEWTEINSAWGQTVLLLHCLAKKINLTFERYRLVPYGSHSYLIQLENETMELPLYCLGGIKYVLDHRFDHAMVAFLDCLQQFKEKVEDGDSSFHLPYRMDKGKIEDKSSGKSYSVKIHLNSQEQWTKALKFMLTNLKWALAWVSTQFQEN